MHNVLITYLGTVRFILGAEHGLEHAHLDQAVHHNFISSLTKRLTAKGRRPCFELVRSNAGGIRVNSSFDLSRLCSKYSNSSVISTLVAAIVLFLAFIKFEKKVARYNTLSSTSLVKNQPSWRRM